MTAHIKLYHVTNTNYLLILIGLERRVMAHTFIDANASRKRDASFNNLSFHLLRVDGGTLSDNNVISKLTQVEDTCPNCCLHRSSEETAESYLECKSS
mmetsp:Transcript_26551/g.81631  ORF Transcript_26551/g.81631 Transcript_26551/m.81631 type:complete len:98 (-) Transcript_26551:241-534(-)